MITITFKQIHQVITTIETRGILSLRLSGSLGLLLARIFHSCKEEYNNHYVKERCRLVRQYARLDDEGNPLRKVGDDGEPLDRWDIQDEQAFVQEMEEVNNRSITLYIDPIPEQLITKEGSGTQYIDVASLCALLPVIDAGHSDSDATGDE